MEHRSDRRKTDPSPKARTHSSISSVSFDVSLSRVFLRSTFPLPWARCPPPLGPSLTAPPTVASLPQPTAFRSARKSARTPARPHAAFPTHLQEQALFVFVFFGFPPFESRAAAAEIWRVVERLIKNSSRLLVTCLQAVGIPLSKGPLKSVTIKNRSPLPMLNPCLHLFPLRKLPRRKPPQVPPEFLLTHLYSPLLPLTPPYSSKVLRLPTQHRFV